MKAMSEAKKLYLKYGGNFFHMDREGEYQFYKNFDVSTEQEESWLQEYQRNLIMDIKIEEDGKKMWLALNALVDTICNYASHSIMVEMLNIVKVKAVTLDSFSRLLISESILRLMDSNICKSQASMFIPYVKTTALDILQSIIMNPITVSQEYYISVINKDVLEPTNIVLRAQKSLERVQD